MASFDSWPYAWLMSPITASNSDMYSLKYGSGSLPKVAVNYIFIVNDRRTSNIKIQRRDQIERQFGAVVKEINQEMILDTKPAR